MTRLTVQMTGEWILAEAELENPLQWARDAVRERAEGVNFPLEPEEIDWLADAMQPALLQVEDPPPAMILFLAPALTESHVTTVKVRAEAVDEDFTLAEIADDVRMPEEMLEQPIVEELVDTSSGPALHMIQRYRQPVNPEVENVLEHEAYMWILQDYDGPMMVLMSTAYVDLVAAAEYRPALRTLATSLVMEVEPDDDWTNDDLS
jgi:hypothetical protein